MFKKNTPLGGVSQLRQHATYYIQTKCTRTQYNDYAGE